MSNWNDIEGHYGYQVSDKGQVRSLAGIIKLSTHAKGYKRVRIQRKNYLVHRLVAIAFLSKETGKDFVNHKNGIKDDNRLENLEWCTISENTAHAYSLGKLSPPMSRLEDIHFLTYATCIRKYKARELTGLMTFSNFRNAMTGKSLRGSMSFLNEYSVKNKQKAI